jgi:hypothetical protein
LGCLQPNRDRLGQLRGRVDLTEQNVGRGAAAGLAEKRAVEDGRYTRYERHGYHAAVGENHNGARVNVQYSIQDCELVHWKVNVGPVETFGLKRSGKTEDHDCHLRVACSAHRFLLQPRRFDRGVSASKRNPGLYDTWPEAAAPIWSTAMSRRVGLNNDDPAPWNRRSLANTPITAMF